MLPIRSLPSPAPSAPSARPPAGAGAGFAIADDPRASNPTATGASEVSLGGMLALQETEGLPVLDRSAVRDRRARRRGRDVLDALASLQRGVLGEGVGADTLHRLAQLAAEPAEAADPALGLILSQILLRARVELARYGFV